MAELSQGQRDFFKSYRTKNNLREAISLFGKPHEKALYITTEVWTWKWSGDKWAETSWLGAIEMECVIPDTGHPPYFTISLITKEDMK